MSDIDWSERFPDMRPVRSAPALFRFNGIGLAVYGSRDHDPETGTYVTTYCLSFVFVPIFALTAYRIADAPDGGWYFLGRVPVSSFARMWNFLVLLTIACVAVMIGWHVHVSSPDYIAGQRLAEADALAAGGQISKAAPVYGELASGGSMHAADASQRLRGLLDDAAVQNSLPDAAAVFRALIQVQQKAGMRAGDLEERGLKLIDRHGEKEPRDALALLDVLQSIATAAAKLTEVRQKLLEHSVALAPNDVVVVSELAVFYEANNQMPRCEKLLVPLKDSLGESEGARILGQIYARKENIDEACLLLEPYTAKKLPNLRSTEQAFHNATQQLITRIRQGHAAGFPYQQYRSADRAKQETILLDYINEQQNSDPSLKQINESYQQARRVVPAALDLGILLLRRAQTRPDAAAREADLKKAESMFLALQNDAAAESNAYRISLGQVYYWLGKHEEGRKKFDEVLAAEKRDPQILMQIAHILREVGERSQACALLEEAYNTEPDKEKKFEAALSRAVMAPELDEKIDWLQRADPSSSEVRANLSKSRADKAMQEGKPAEGEQLLRQALDHYDLMPEEPAVLNNSALVLLTLYSVTGDRQLLEKAESKFDKAVSLQPRNSILLQNAVRSLLDAAVRDVIGAAIDLTALKHSGEHWLLSYLYDDRAGQRRILDRFCRHPATIKAKTYLERLLILAPKSPGVYRQLVSLYEDERNLDKLRDLAARLERVSLDLADEETRTREFHAGKRDEKNRKEGQAQLNLYKERVEATSKGRRGATYAVAATELAGLKLTLSVVGMDVDSNEVVQLAVSAYQAAPSVTTRGFLEAALLFRANGNLARKDAAFAALVSQTRRVFSHSGLIAVVLERDGKLRSLALADADVQRVLAMIREDQHKAPDLLSAWSWAMLHHDQPEAEKIAKVLRGDAIDGLVRVLNVKLHPLSADSALRCSWGLRAAGKDKEAATILQQCAARGVPMPRIQ